MSCLVIFKVHVTIYNPYNLYLSSPMRHNVLKPFTVAIKHLSRIFNNFVTSIQWNLKITLDSLYGSALENIIWINTDADKFIL